uniref:Uncharacterized protein n=1 Tax=Arundo donax TaxID=35708 RepID=A0A0A9HRN3_ARUDO
MMRTLFAGSRERLTSAAAASTRAVACRGRSSTCRSVPSSHVQ